MLLDPYADPLWDTEPCPQRAAQQAAAKNRSLAEIFEATLKSRDHNVLMTALTGMYARLEGMEALSPCVSVVPLLFLDSSFLPSLLFVVLFP
jgi:hypothetical protein